MIQKKTGLLILASALTAPAAFGSGYEKSVVFSGKYSGMGNAAQGQVAGAESLYFNPAGLGGLKQGSGDMSLNISLTSPKFEGVIAGSTLKRESASKTTFPFGALFGYGLTENLGIGAGVYVSGGTKAVFEGLDYSAVNAGFDTLKPEVKAELSVIEYALGLGYQVAPGFKVGGSWRIASVNADLSSVGVVGSGASLALVNLKYTDLKATRYNGFKFGFQYAPENAGWGVGGSWRTEIGFIAKGNLVGLRELNATTGGLLNVNGTSTGSTAAAEASSIFPQQISFGGFYDITPKVWRVAAEWVWTEYSKVDFLRLNGTSVVTEGTTSNITTTGIFQNWKAQTNLRLGTEYALNDAWMLRAGYVWTSQVTPEDRVRATFTPPGAASTFTLGAGWALSPSMDLNFAGEYTTVSGSGTNPLEAIAANDYKASAMVLHTGFGYRF